MKIKSKLGIWAEDAIISFCEYNLNTVSIYYFKCFEFF